MDKPIYARYGFSDVRILKDEDPNTIDPRNTEIFFVGWEDEDGNECEKDGTPLE